MDFFPKLIISEGRNLYHGVNRILTHYCIRCDPYLCLGICTINGIPCPCIYCINFMSLPWDPYLVPKDQLRYYSVTTC